VKFNKRKCTVFLEYFLAFFSLALTAAATPQGKSFRFVGFCQRPKKLKKKHANLSF
jgi:hypothetical protein